MYFLEVLCALAAALLFADAAYLKKSISSTPIRDSEMLLYKVTCDSACNIKAIRLEGVSGCLTLEAFSDSIKFCTKNHGNILCPLYNKIGFQMPLDNCYGKSISEKVFWIYLKPETKFSGGHLIVILGGKGNIQELNYGGASVQNRQGYIAPVPFVPLELLRFFSPDRNYVRIKTGFETIKITDRLKQYKIGCNGRCRGILLYSQTSEKVIIAAADHPVFFKTGRCYNCFCESSSGGNLKKCEKSGAIRFNTESSSFYVILVPDVKLTDVFAYILGDNIKSVDNYGTYKDGQYSYTYPDGSSKHGLFLPKYPIRDYERLVFRVTCTSKCIIYEIEMEGYTGRLQMYAASASGIFCLNQAKKCPSKRLNENIFYITLIPNPEFEGGKLTVRLGQKGEMDELDANCASTFGETGGHDPKYVRIKSGSFTTKFPKYLRLYEIQCDGNCRNIDFHSRTNENVILVAAEEPVFVKDGGCYNCFCVSNKNQGYKQQCVKDGKMKFNLQKKSIYVTMVPDKEIKGVRAFVKGDNIKSIKEYVRNPKGWPVYDTKDGYRAAAHRLKHAPKGSKTTLGVYCTGKTRCDDIKIEVFADPTVETIHAGKLYKNGNCEVNGCFCNSVASCKKRTSPKMYDIHGQYVLVVYIRVGKSQKKYPGYVKISGKHIEKVEVLEELLFN